MSGWRAGRAITASCTAGTGLTCCDERVPPAVDASVPACEGACAGPAVAPWEVPPFGPSVLTVIEAGAAPLALADVTCDGRRDAITGRVRIDGDDVITGAVVVHPGRADGRFAPPISIDLGAGPAAAVAGDFDGDGVTDLAGAASSGFGQGRLGWLRMACPGGLGPPSSALEPSPYLGTDLEAADVDRDGVDDLIVARWEAPFRVEVLLGGAPPFARAVRGPALAGRPTALAALHADGDGGVDLGVIGEGGLDLVRDDGAGGLRLAAHAPLPGPGSAALASARLADGAALLVSRWSPPGLDAYRYLPASATLVARELLPFTVDQAASADLDGDGDHELVTVTGDRTLIHVDGDTARAPTVLLAPRGTVLAGDVTGDQRPELVHVAPGGGLIETLLDLPVSCDRRPAACDGCASHAETSYPLAVERSGLLVGDLTGPRACWRPRAAAPSSSTPPTGPATCSTARRPSSTLAAGCRASRPPISTATASTRCWRSGSARRPRSRCSDAVVDRARGPTARRATRRFEAMSCTHPLPIVVSVFLAGGCGSGDGSAIDAGAIDAPPLDGAAIDAPPVAAYPCAPYGPSTISLTSITPGEVAVGDLDCDGVLDAVVTDPWRNDDGVHLHRGTGDRAPRFWRTLGLRDRASATAVGDFDGDGVADVTTWTIGATTPAPRRLAFSRGRCGLGPAGPWTPPGTDALLPTAVVDDVDGDGADDLVALDGVERSSVVVLFGGGGPFDRRTAIATSGEYLEARAPSISTATATRICWPGATSPGAAASTRSSTGGRPAGARAPPSARASSASPPAISTAMTPPRCCRRSIAIDRRTGAWCGPAGSPRPRRWS
jgi:hypothetical protein